MAEEEGVMEAEAAGPKAESLAVEKGEEKEEVDMVLPVLAMAHPAKVMVLQVKVMVRPVVAMVHLLSVPATMPSLAIMLSPAIRASLHMEEEKAVVLISRQLTFWCQISICQIQWTSRPVS